MHPRGQYSGEGRAPKRAVQWGGTCTQGFARDSGQGGSEGGGGREGAGNTQGCTLTAGKPSGLRQGMGTIEAGRREGRHNNHTWQYFDSMTEMTPTIRAPVSPNSVALAGASRKAGNTMGQPYAVWK